MPPRRLVRRQPLTQRLRAWFDPWDYLLRVSEELDSGDWEQWLQDWSIPLGTALNLVMLIARANSGRSSRGADDVFGDDMLTSSWMTWLVSMI